MITVRDTTGQVLVRGEEYDALVAHALRAPLTALLLFASALQRSLRGQGLDADADIAERIERNGARIGAIIDEILEATSLERGDVALHRVPLELSEVVAACVERLDDAARYRVVVEEAEAPCPVLGDPDHLESAITNLVANALDGSPADASVRLVLGRIGGDVALDVIDRGVGVACDDRVALFDRFHRGSRHTGTSGLGLGLYIVRLVAEGHGGRVEVRAAPGGGSFFRLLLPAC